MAKVRFEQQICAYTQVNVEDVQYITYFNISLPLSEKMEKKSNVQLTYKILLNLENKDQKTTAFVQARRQRYVRRVLEN